MALLYASGQYLNALARISSTSNVVASPTFDTNFPPSALYDGDPGTVGKFGTASSGSTITVDLNVLFGGDFDSTFTSSAGSTGPAGWTNVSIGGTISRTTQAGEFINVAGLKCTSTSTGGYGGVQGTILARPDESLQLLGRHRGDGGGITSNAYLRNPITGKWWDGSNWVTTSSAFSSSISGVFGVGTVNATIVMESFQSCGGFDAVSLQLSLLSGTSNSISGAAFFDEWYASPIPNAAVLLGAKDVGPKAGAFTPRVWDWQASTSSGFGATTVVSASIEVTGPGKGLPNSWVTATTTNTLRFQQFSFPGAPTTGPSFGEAIFCYLNTALKNQRYGYSIKPYKRQVRNESRGGVVRVYPYATYPEVSLTLSFSHESRTQMEELLHQWWLRSGAGQFPILVVPDSTGTGMDQTILYGRMPDTVEITRPLTTVWDWSAIVLVGLPLP